eukprot:scaffold30797_cov146-Isochrysis_galbana.AAC.1
MLIFHLGVHSCRGESSSPEPRYQRHEGPHHRSLHHEHSHPRACQRYDSGPSLRSSRPSQM